MSVGSWILSASGASTALAAANAWTGLLPHPAKLARPLAATMGLPLCTYTAALVATTAVPVWHESRRMLPFVFASGAALSAAGASIVLTPAEHAAPARRLALAAAASELASKEVMERRLKEVGQPYKEGDSAAFGRLSRACIAAGSALLVWRGASSRLAGLSSGTLLCAGALSARWSVLKAGVQGASDPKYVIGPQRGQIDRGRSRGGARRRSRATTPERPLATPADSLPAK
jgi:hypothetical protein